MDRYCQRLWPAMALRKNGGYVLISYLATSRCIARSLHGRSGTIVAAAPASASAVDRLESLAMMLGGHAVDPWKPQRIARRTPLMRLRAITGPIKDICLESRSARGNSGQHGATAAGNVEVARKDVIVTSRHPLSMEVLRAYRETLMKLDRATNRAATLV